MGSLYGNFAPLKDKLRSDFRSSSDNKFSDKANYKSINHVFSGRIRNERYPGLGPYRVHVTTLSEREN